MLRLQGVWISSTLAAAIGLCAIAQELIVRSTGDQISIGAPNFHFLQGKPLERIRGGSAVAFDFQVSVLGEAQTVLHRSAERYVISYDLWEEKFSVSRTRSGRSGVSRLSAPAAEAWCIENLRFSAAGLPDDKPIWVRLDIRAQDRRTPGEDETLLSLSNLIDIFSRAGKPQESNQWRLEAGPLRLADLRRLRGDD